MRLLHDKLHIKQYLQIFASCQVIPEGAGVMNQAGSTTRRRKNAKYSSMAAVEETSIDSKPKRNAKGYVANQVKHSMTAITFTRNFMIWEKLFVSENIKSKKISNDQEMIQSDPTYCTKIQTGSN